MHVNVHMHVDVVALVCGCVWLCVYVWLCVGLCFWLCVCVCVWLYENQYRNGLGAPMAFLDGFVYKLYGIQ
jgi:hypothetical protein